MLLLAIVLLLIVGSVWLFTGHSRPSVFDVVSETDTVVVADTARADLGISTATGPKHTRKKGKNRNAKPLEPRRSPLDEPIPVTK